MKLTTLIFDVDGTLADTEEAHRQAFNQAFARAGLDWDWTPALYRVLLGTTGGKERMAAHIQTLKLPPGERRRMTEMIPALHEAKTAIYTALVARGALPLRPGVARLCEEALAAGCRLAIASTTTAANVDALLDATWGPQGLDMFSVIACGDQVRAKKPAPDIYQLALSHLGAEPEEAVAFEDSVHGLQSARAAGLRCVVTPTYWTDGGDFSAAVLELPHLGDPAQPLLGEPDGALREAAWLTLEELASRIEPPRRLDPVTALYAGVNAGARA